MAILRRKEKNYERQICPFLLFFDVNDFIDLLDLKPVVHLRQKL